jgi:predicted DNA-binding transcriptional regulator AlpA
MSEEQYNSLMKKFNDLEVLLQKSIGEKVAGGRVGGMSLAMEVTGYTRRTIYRKVNEGMPHSGEGTKLFFDEKELRDWMMKRKSNDKPEVIKQNKKNRRRPSLIDNSFKLS